MDTPAFMLTPFLMGAIPCCLGALALALAYKNKRDRQEMTLRMDHDKQLRQVHDTYGQQLKTLEMEAGRCRYEAQAAKELQARTEAAHKEAMAQMEHRFVSLSEEVLRKRQDELDKANRETLTAMVRPVREDLQKMQQSMVDARMSSASQHATLDKTIESLSLFAHDMAQKTADLTRALQAGGKMQGDWGEQLLASILEGSGLRPGEEFETQASVKDNEGNSLRPDVIVHCPGGRNIIIDSKVSLTAYLNYNAAHTPEEAEAAKKDNLRSIRTHIDELERKHYDQLVAGALPQVLMFIPNEGSYILALRTDPQIGQYAYRKHIILINPTNLMLSLQMIYNLWQTERQNKNTERVMKQAAELYDKFAVFCEKFNRIRQDIDGLRTHADDALNTLSAGRGNIVRRLESLKQLGVTPKKQIDENLTDD